MEQNGRGFIYFAIILGLSIFLSSVVAARTFLSVRKLDNVISVTGSAKKQVTADSARWTGSFSRSVFKDQIKSGYAQMKSDEKAVADFFASQGFQVEISPVFVNEIYKSDQNLPREYNLVQNVSLKSDDVNKLKELAKNSDKLADKGVFFSANPVEYYYSKLPDLRISLLPDAISDAKKRVETIAGSSGRKVDAVRSVSMGVVQVVPVGTLDVSDYGSYDTSQIEKEVLITVKATFGLK